MPQYQFECRREYDGCGFVFDIFCGMDEISEKTENIECPECHSKTAVFRDWGIGCAPSTFTTLGMLADRQAAKLSKEEKQHLREKHKTKKEGKFHE